MICLVSSQIEPFKAYLSQYQQPRRILRLEQQRQSIQTKHPRPQTPTQQPSLRVTESVLRRAGSRHMPAGQQTRTQRQMQRDPRERGIHRVAHGVGTVQGAVVMHIQPVQTEGDNEGPDGAQEAKIQPDGSGGPHDDLVQELAQHDDVEGREPVDLVRDVDGRGVPRLQDALRRGRVAEDPDALLDRDADGGGGDLPAHRHGLDVQRDVDAEGERGEQTPEPLLCAVVVAGEGVEEVRGVAGESRDHVRGDGGAHGAEVLVDEGGVVAVDDEDGHHPEDEDALQQVVVVEGVHQLAEVAPYVPGGG